MSARLVFGNRSRPRWQPRNRSSEWRKRHNWARHRRWKEQRELILWKSDRDISGRATAIKDFFRGEIFFNFSREGAFGGRSTHNFFGYRKKFMNSLRSEGGPDGRDGRRKLRYFKLISLKNDNFLVRLEILKLPMPNGPPENSWILDQSTGRKESYENFSDLPFGRRRGPMNPLAMPLSPIAENPGVKRESKRKNRKKINSKKWPNVLKKKNFLRRPPSAGLFLEKFVLHRSF